MQESTADRTSTGRTYFDIGPGNDGSEPAEGARKMIQNEALSAVSTANQSRSDNEPLVFRREAMAPWQARCIQEYISANLHSTIRVTDLVRTVQLAPNRFVRVFRESFGCTPHQYLMRARIARARRLLLMSDDTLSKIAVECGFVNQSHLSNIFRRTMGQPPGTWRRVQLNENL